MWLLPITVIVLPIILAIPLSGFMARIMDGNYRPWPAFEWFEKRLDSGHQNWKQYTLALLIFNTLLYLFGYLVLSLQPWMPLNPRGLGMLSPSTIFNTVISFSTNTDIQHYSGDQSFSNFSQIFFCLPMFFLSAAIGLCALTAIIRAFRSDSHLGNFFVDMWRVVIYLFLPAAFVLSVLFLIQGMPMTFQSDYQVNTLEPAAMGTDNNNQPKQQTIVVGPLAAFVPMKMLGTNGGGFYGMNSAHPFENPTAGSNIATTSSFMLFPMALVLMYGRMLSRRRHSVVIFAVMLTLLVGTVLWTIYFDTLKPNPGLTAHSGPQNFEIASATAPGGKRVITLPAVASLPVDQHLGNLEGKELRFGTSAGSTFAALTVDFTCGAVICEHDSLNPIAGLSPMFGMWVNCIFGGKGVGMVNMLLFLIIGIFVVGQMVGRTPEYLGKKIGPREVKLAMIALLVHPLVILMPTGLFAATDWGIKAESNPGPHGFSQIVYQFSSDSANNGSAFDGLGTTYGLNNNPSPAPEAVPWDIAAGFVIMFGRFLPIIAPIAMAGFLGMKKSSPFGLGTLRDDTFTFGCLLFGTIVIIGALLFLPAAALGPLADHFGPIPFGG
ncbi:potassium-transporting ATPase subunit KdpA [Candidatus Binatus sp.]|jgi:potassium-transporting ATPase potassium-binding subunit|uniref:potassium-transporting ATPase subunit KdpA n=1 Tax=Candidatus Binatus sp. TaxID=2811406 RepID=UPI003BE296E9